MEKESDAVKSMRKNRGRLNKEYNYRSRIKESAFEVAQTLSYPKGFSLTNPFTINYSAKSLQFKRVKNKSYKRSEPGIYF